MGQSTDGQICFGVAFPEGFEFPWDVDEKADGDIEEWWKNLKGFKPLFEMWDEHGDYKDGKEPSDAEKKKYYDHKDKWEEENPVPISLVNYCSGDCPMYMIAVTTSLKKNNRGYPEAFEPSKLTVTPDEIRVLKEFMEKYIPFEDIEDKEFDPEPKWYLSSYWG